MNLKKNLILGAITAGAASLGATATAIIMTRECHKMMESNKIENEEIKKELEKNKKEMEQIKRKRIFGKKAFKNREGLYIIIDKSDIVRDKWRKREVW